MVYFRTKKGGIKDMVGAIIGIARISRSKQKTDRQVYNIQKKYPHAKIIKIIYSGAKVIGGQKDFDRTIKNLKEGDLLVFDSVTRMSRNSEKGVALYEELFKKDVDIEFLKDSEINTSVYRQALKKRIEIKIETGADHTDKFLNSIIDACNELIIDLAKDQVKKKFDQAQEELENIQKNTKDGMVIAKRDGKQIGRTGGIKIETKKAKVAKEIMLKHCRAFGGSLTDKDVMAIIEKAVGKIHRETYYIYKKQLRQKQDRTPTALYGCCI